MLKNIPGFDGYLLNAYVDHHLTMRLIADEIGCSPATILHQLRRLDIPTRDSGDYLKGIKLPPWRCLLISKAHKGKKVSMETRKKLSETRKAKHFKSPNWNGGKRTGRTDKYIQVYRPAHPYASKEGYVMEHRLVMEQKLDRYLKPNEIVHHINGNCSDNVPENLELFDSVGLHTSYHSRTRKGETA